MMQGESIACICMRAEGVISQLRDGRRFGRFAGVVSLVILYKLILRKGMPRRLNRLRKSSYVLMKEEAPGLKPALF